MISEARKQAKKRYSKTEKGREARRGYMKKYLSTPKGKQKLLEAVHRSQHKTKLAVLTHYSNGKCACVRCGESDINCLTIDHMKAVQGGERIRPGYFYRWLIKNNFPEGYQTLCMNCHWRKRAEEKEYRLT